ncbi:hypothetical protein POJ91_001047 [Salmonella enterica]|uniref:Uncharacterized protein n=1 Tax=Salmonella enterica subsp. enterica serovar Pomona TaxID=570935 RepID=A0A5I9WUX7_SALET|nr:hypothetical protein CHD23_09595 [Salmonella enterica]EBS1322326.1 hypothetical protein [Salmonella enterica subsp. enterica serovar Pomona]EDI4378394.1 hypothetical protein [Salmonella enterica subsp. enterica serovar Montevideo]EAN9661259.1 hypothetical protein [Salmonella enterica]EAP8158307.1 hypothetical protein [Salmonella enterica]
MQSRSLLLDIGTWDILLDDTGNLAITDNPHAVAQDVACACSTFLGECWYDSTSGIPYWSRILGHWPGTQLVNATLQQEALKLPTVSAAICQVSVDKARTVTGVLRITDTNNDIFTILL